MLADPSEAAACCLGRWFILQFIYLFDSIGRGGRIRTADPLRPRQVRYQAALRPDWRFISIVSFAPSSHA